MVSVDSQGCAAERSSPFAQTACQTAYHLCIGTGLLLAAISLKSGSTYVLMGTALLRRSLSRFVVTFWRKVNSCGVTLFKDNPNRGTESW